ncbi:hypothetical protein GGR56DRAFT_327245 [Xylariaceae sp. FL0804]|nr:hypothetical protein GGR56DRAFT_327245 [Xylariaceae sp. FL0804]
MACRPLRAEKAQSSDRWLALCRGLKNTLDRPQPLESSVAVATLALGHAMQPESAALGQEIFIESTSNKLTPALSGLTQRNPFPWDTEDSDAARLRPVLSSALMAMAAHWSGPSYNGFEERFFALLSVSTTPRSGHKPLCDVASDLGSPIVGNTAKKPRSMQAHAFSLLKFYVQILAYHNCCSSAPEFRESPHGTIPSTGWATDMLWTQAYMDKCMPIICLTSFSLIPFLRNLTACWTEPSSCKETKCRVYTFTATRNSNSIIEPCDNTYSQGLDLL